MITKDEIKETLANLEKPYVNFMVSHFAEWRKWAAASQKMLDGEKVDEKEIPSDFVLEFKMLMTVLEMEATGKFDWSNPQLREHFAQLAQSPSISYGDKPSLKFH